MKSAEEAIIPATELRDKGKAEGALSTDLATSTLDEAEQERRALWNTIARLHRFNSADREAQEHVLGDGLREVPVEGCKGKGDMACTTCKPHWPCAGADPMAMCMVQSGTT